jgi:WD40 repeat protein
MKNDGPEFTPEQVDQQIDLLARSPKTWLDPSSDAHLISELYQVYGDDASIANRAWQRLAERVQAAGLQPGVGNATFQTRPPMDTRANWQKGPHIMQMQTPMQFQTPQKRPPRRSGRLLGLCAALLVIVVFVAGMAVVLNDIHQQPGPSAPASSSTKTPTPFVDEGKVIYHSGTISALTSIAWSPDGQRIAEASPQRDEGPWQLKSWDALTGQHGVTYHITNLSLYGEDAFTSVAWSPDGHSLAVVDFTGRIDIFDVQSGKLTHTFSPTLALSTVSTLPLAFSGGDAQSPLSSLFPQSGEPITLPEISWSPDGAYMVESIPGKIVIWNVTTDSPVKQLTDNNPGDLRAFWQPHGNLLAIIACSNTTCMPNISSGTIETSAFIWDTTTWRLVKQYPGVYTLDWSPDRKQLALVDRQSVSIVEAATGQTVKQFVRTQVTAIHWSPDGNRLALEGPTGTITIWSIADGKLRYTFPQYVFEASWSPDGKYIACIQDVKTSSGSANPEIAIWIA